MRAIALIIPCVGPSASDFGFVPLLWHLMGAAILIVLGYVLATEATKVRFFRETRRS